MASYLDLLLGAQVQNNGTKLTPRRYLNFGSGFTVTDDPTNDRYTLTAAGGGLVPPVVLQATAGSQTPFTLQGFTGQTADLQQWKDVAGAILTRVKANGALVSATLGAGVVESTSAGELVSVSRLPVNDLVLGGANQIIWSNGTTNSWTGAPILSTSLTVNSGAAPAASQLRVHANSAGGASLVVSAVDNCSLALDADWAASAFTARHTSAALIRKFSALLIFYGDTGLTNGNTFTPTARANLNLANGNFRIGDSTAGAEKLDVLGNIVIDKTIATPKVYVADNTTNGATATSFTFQAPNATGTDATGGKVVLKAGSGTGAGSPGNVELAVATALGANHGKFSFTEGGVEFLSIATTTGVPKITSTSDLGVVASGFFTADATNGAIFRNNTGATTFATIGNAFLSIGATPATAGSLRIPNNTYLSARNAANNANLDLWKANGSDQLQTGMLTVAGHVTTTSGGVISSVLDMQVKNKTADESVTSSTTLQNDDHLVFPILANETWVAKFVIWCTFAATSGAKVAITLPSGATTQIVASITDSSSSTAQVSTTPGGAITLNSPNVDATAAKIELEATIVNAGNAGDVQLQFAQITSSATSLVFKQNSSVTAIRK